MFHHITGTRARAERATESHKPGDFRIFPVSCPRSRNANTTGQKANMVCLVRKPAPAAAAVATHHATACLSDPELRSSRTACHTQKSAMLQKHSRGASIVMIKPATHAPGDAAASRAATSPALEENMALPVK